MFMATTKKTTKKKAAPKTAKKKAVKKAAVKKKAAPKKASAKTKATSSKIKVTPEQHHKMICEAAYYISLERTHETVNPTEDWLQAEAAINKICSIHGS
jgi:hypothetical protein